MSADVTPTPRWNGNRTCPFCGESIDDPGAGFIEHTESSGACRQAFDGWRDRIKSDIGGEWSG